MNPLLVTQSFTLLTSREIIVFRDKFLCARNNKLLTPSRQAAKINENGIVRVADGLSQKTLAPSRLCVIRLKDRCPSAHGLQRKLLAPRAGLATIRSSALFLTLIETMNPNLAPQRQTTFPLRFRRGEGRVRGRCASIRAETTVHGEPQ